MKRCSTAYAIRKLQIKTMRYHLKSKALTTADADEAMEQEESHPSLVGVQNGTITLEDKLDSFLPN
ncbi:hypothetical protein DHT93_09720 [Streptococcus australis]|nr:hypothetical protein DHT93_09720 [Streptococcus australis]